MIAFFWAVFGIVGTVAVAYFFEGSGLQNRAAKRSEKKSRQRIEQLQKELEQVESFHSDRVLLNGYLIARLLLVTLLWIAQGALDYLDGLVSNTSSSASVFGFAPTYDPTQVNTAVAAAGSVVGVVLLTIIFMIGLRGYNVWRNVQRFDSYKDKVKEQIKELQSSIRSRYPGQDVGVQPTSSSGEIPPGPSA